MVDTNHSHEKVYYERFNQPDKQVCTSKSIINDSYKPLIILSTH